MKKIIPIFVIGIFVISSFSAIATIENNKPVDPISDDLDQYQDVMTEAAIPVGNFPIPENPSIYIQAAQSFIPTKEIITRVELYIGKNSSEVLPLDVSIRKELTEEDLTVASIDPGIVPIQSYDWIEADIDDLKINPGETYYIVALTENITDNFYGWGANNISESYPYGCMWISIDEGKNWTNQSSSENIKNTESFSYQAKTTNFEENITWDMCFKTYGRDNNPPDMPTIEGPTSGKPGETMNYVFYSTDPDDDQVYYWISWFDDCPGVYWDGPFNSGEHINRGYTYEEQGTYTIRVKSKDVHDAESDWAILEIEIPRSRHINHNFLYLLNQLFPNVVPTIIKILK
ncbi:hypothetical protein AYK21_02145 [Thermoplasmatales archaeon SG8-52-2]|nr:MAG: hypothetical protein AYK21_02145 [Thermoplasmatales archaeon SG8-52-2]